MVRKIKLKPKILTANDKKLDDIQTKVTKYFKRRSECDLTNETPQPKRRKIGMYNLSFFVRNIEFQIYNFFS